MEGNIIQLKEYHLNKGTSKDHTPVFPMTKASAIEGMAELLKDLNISGVTPTSDISDVNSPEKGKIYYEESTDKYYVYSEDKSSFVELGAGASVDPSDVMPTVTQTTSSEQSGGDNIITFTFPNGETAEIVIKNGTQGNSGYTGAANELEVVNNLEDGGPTAALSAEMGKQLAEQTLPGEGTFAKAYLKAVDVNVPFPWILKDTDGNGNSITKMIWHIGNREFVDAAGADVNWYKDGVTFITEGPCALYIRHTNNELKYIVLPKAGLHNVSFSDLRKTDANPYGKVSQLHFLNTTTETIDGVETIVPISLQNEWWVDGTPNARYTGVTYVNFGGLIITDNTSFYCSELDRSKVQTIENLVMQGTSGSWHMWLNTTTSLKNINNIRGTLGYSIQSGGNQTFRASLGGLTYVTKLDLSKLTCPMMCIGIPNLKYLDIRGMNPTINYSGTNNNPNYDYTLEDNWITNTSNLRTLVIGDFDTSNIVGVSSGRSFISNLTNCTLVCTKATPPATNQSGYVIDDLLNKVTTILVPPGAKTAYQNADWWGNYASKMSEYNEGDY